MKIKYWADFECPYCFISETNLYEASHELGMEDDVEIEMKAYELDPKASKHYTLSIQEKFEKEEGMSPAEAQQRFHQIHRYAEDADLHFDFTKMRYTNDFDAHRLYKYAREQGVEDKIRPLLFEAYFIENKELANRETLYEVARKAGLNHHKVEEMLDSEAYKDDVRKDESQAEILEIESVPYFMIGEQIVPGYRDKKQFKEILKNNTESGKTGASCSPKSCG